MIKKLMLWVLAGLLWAGSGVGWAAEPAKVAVFPFDVFSREPLDQMRQGLQEMLIKKLKTEGVSVLDAGEVNKALAQAGKPLDLTLARNLAGKLGAEYAIYGSLTKIGNNVSLDAKLLDVLGMRRPQSVFAEGAGMDALQGLTDRLARELGTLAAGREQVATVEVQGNKRIEAEAVKAVMQTKAGGPYAPVRLDEDLRAVWKMGYFDDVRMETKDTGQGKVVTVVVKEKPTIRELNLVGNKAIDEKDLRDQIGIKPFAVFKPEAVKEAEEKIVKLYHDKGYYDVKVASTVGTTPSGDPSVTFNIEEGKKVFIKTITFTGNKAFSVKELKEAMSTTESGWFTWLTESNILERNKLDQDLEKLTDFYYNHGYMNARVGEPSVTRGPDGLVVSIPVEEGPRFKVSDVALTGEMIKPQAELAQAMKTKPGEWFNRDQLRADIAYLNGLYADQGFAYVDVRPQIQQDQQKQTVSISFSIKKGDKVYFERILITGNTHTRDNVIRRELGVAEGDLFSGSALRQGNMRLHRLNYFEDVHISTTKGSAPDRMDLKIDVKEKRTGQFSIGAGYSTVDKVMLMGRVAESNLFGRGQQLEFRGQIGGVSNRYTISFTEPWLFDKPVSFGVDLYDWDREYFTYSKEALGGRIRLGWPTPLPATRLYTYYTYEVANIYDIQNNAARIIRDQEGEHTTSSLRGILRRDTRDHVFNPTRGSDNSISVEYAGGPLGGTNAFTKVIGDTGWYFPLWWEHVFVLHGRMGWMAGHSGGDLPIYEKFFLGGINTLRGFDYQSVSPRDPATNDRIGGERMALANVEYRFPLLAKAGLVGVVFYDTGNVWTEDQGYEFSDLRSSVGGGIRWYSPMGPLRLEYGYVLDPKPDDSQSNWEFTIGSIF
ncbi:MAG: outer membrane protein assembly factor BamA [Thermodesulfobacteriota bacterium]